MYIRFTTEFVNEYGETHTGLFSALAFVREYALTEDADIKELKALRAWFNENLEAPDRFSNANNKNPEAISLSWFKDSAKSHIKKVYEVIHLLEKYDVIAEIVTCVNPGYIINEDEYQVSAVPFKADRKRVK